MFPPSNARADAKPCQPGYQEPESFEEMIETDQYPFIPQLSTRRSGTGGTPALQDPFAVLTPAFPYDTAVANLFNEQLLSRLRDAGDDTKLTVNNTRQLVQTEPKVEQPTRQPLGPRSPGSERGFIRHRLQALAHDHSGNVTMSLTNTAMDCTPVRSSNSLYTGLHDAQWASRTPSLLTSLSTPSSANISDFRPSGMLLERQGLAARHPGSQLAGSNYRGDVQSNSYRRQLRDLEDSQNCSLWLRRIPATITVTQIFDHLRGSGTIYALHLSLPTVQHPTTAAKLVFTTPEAAALVIHTSRTVGIWMHGVLIDVVYNRNGHLRHHNTVETRVLHIEGPEEIMNVEYWLGYFGSACLYELDRWDYLRCDEEGRTGMEFRFGRVE